MDTLFNLARQSLAGLRALLVLTVLLGVAYPLMVTGIAAVAMPWQAQGSLITASGEHTTSYDDAVGSLHLGQDFTGREWFHVRPSMAGEGYDPLASAGSNLGPENPELVATIEERRAEVAAREGVAPADVPADALTASASGLDPHISRGYADIQAARVADARDLDRAEVEDLVAEHTDSRTIGVLGEQRVNVLALNRAIAALTR